MGRDHELLQAVREQDVVYIHKILMKNRGSKTKLIGSAKRINLNFQDGDGMVALHQAALVGNLEIMKMLLEGGACVDIKDSKGMRSLHYAAWQGKQDPVAMLLQWGSSANEQAIDGNTPLHLACEHGHFDVVNLLLRHQGDPALYNKNNKTPLDLACEFGKYRVVELLIHSNLCNRLLLGSPDDMSDNKRSTCLHLAAKNGHSDIIRLLLQAGVDINRSTLQGTCLHEAALYGKIEVVKLLLDCGIDVNRPNSYDQTALDIVNKFTTSRAAKELKSLLKEASYAVTARVVKEYSNMHEPNHISFKEGDLITVLEQHGSGMWKGYMTNDGQQLTRTGYFPSSHVVLIDSHQGSNRMLSQYGSRKTLTPSVPDLLNGRQMAPQGCNGVVNGPHIDMAHIGGTVGSDESFPPPPSPLIKPKNGSSSSGDSDRDSGISPQQNCPSQPFPGQAGYGRQPSPNTPADRTAEWLGRYVEPEVRSGSPNRESPNSSNRNSIASSGGSSGGYLTGHSGYASSASSTQQHRLSGQSYESGVSSRQSYHSTSSSSLGSLDRLEESGYASTVNVHELFQQGLADGEILRAWLADLHFEEYYNLFIQAGYDMPTISRMTPEDLTAIGITKPVHRKRLKAEISKLHIHDGIPDFKPNDVIEWCRLLGLEEYYDILDAQGYKAIEQLTDITWEDLEEIGIQKLGHQKKIMLAIDRLKRIQNVTRRLSSMDRRGSQEMLEPPSAFPTPKWLAQGEGKPPSSPGPHSPVPHNAFPHSPLPHNALPHSPLPKNALPHSPLPKNAMPHSPLPKPSLSHSPLPHNALPHSPIPHNALSHSPLLHGPASHSSHYGESVVITTRKPRRSLSGENLCMAAANELKTFQYKEDEIVHLRQNKPSGPTSDLVAIQVNRNSGGARGSGDSAYESETGTPVTYQSFHSPVHRVKGESDGDSTPTNDQGSLSSDETDASTLKRPSAKVSPRISPKPKPVAKIMAKSKQHSRELPGELIKMEGAESNSMAYSSCTLPRKSSSHSQSHHTEHIYDSPAEFMQQQVEGGKTTSFSGSAPNSPAHGSGIYLHSPWKKKAPPPPPKRTNSIKCDGRLLADLKRSSEANTSSSCSNLNVVSGQSSAHQQALSTCIAGLSQRFGAQRERSEGPTPVAPPTVPSKPVLAPRAPSPTGSDDFPPPPPPIAVEVDTNFSFTDSDNPLGDVIESLEKGQVSPPSQGSNGKSKGIKLGDWQDNRHSDSGEDSDSGLDKRNESTTSLDSNSSDSSTNTLPFANENVGTIKQRTAAAKPSILTVSNEDSPDGSDSKCVDLNSDMFEEGSGTIKRNPKSEQSQGQDSHKGAEVKKVPPPTPKRRESMTGPTPHEYQGVSAGASGGQGGDVLNDIDNMLQDLTDELDAMLEFEC